MAQSNAHALSATAHRILDGAAQNGKYAIETGSIWTRGKYRGNYGRRDWAVCQRLIKAGLVAVEATDRWPNTGSGAASLVVVTITEAGRQRLAAEAL